MTRRKLREHGNEKAYQTAPPKEERAQSSGIGRMLTKWMMMVYRNVACRVGESATLTKKKKKKKDYQGRKTSRSGHVDEGKMKERGRPHHAETLARQTGSLKRKQFEK
jgi:hypothetical protein